MSEQDEATMAKEFKEFNRNLIEEFRTNNGKVGGMFEGAPLLLLTTTGARTGEARVVPLAYTKDGDRFVIIASKGGAPSHPDWYYNLGTNPEVTVEVGTKSFPRERRSSTETSGSGSSTRCQRRCRTLPSINAIHDARFPSSCSTVSSNLPDKSARREAVDHETEEINVKHVATRRRCSP